MPSLQPVRTPRQCQPVANDDRIAILRQQIHRRPDTWWGREETPRSAANSALYLPTGYRSLDRVLEGRGWPRGNTVEMLSDGNGMGSMGIFLPAMEQLSRQEERWLLFVAPPAIPYAPLLEARGIDIQRVLLVHPRNRADLLWSIEQGLRSTTCSAVFAWLGAHRYRYAELRRLQLAASSADTLGVLFRPQVSAIEDAPATLRLQLEGYRRLRILKQRGGHQACSTRLPPSEDIPGQPQLWELPTAADPGADASALRSSA